jgi:four helix bundle protein
MSPVEHFEDLIAWQKARTLRVEVYEMARGAKVRREFDFTSQIKRAAVSIMSNIAEGFERGGRAEFAQFLCTAKASCAEVRSLLYVALDEGYIDQPTFARLAAQAQEVGRIVGGLRAAVARQGDEARAKH